MIRLEALPALRDNYIWTVHDNESALIVDPGEARGILAWLEQWRLRPAAILLTHHHADHRDGIPPLLERWPIPVYGSASDAFGLVSHAVAEGDICQIAELALEFRVIETPGHTLDHLSYFGNGYLFCGDTLFSCGCGRVFEGTPAMLRASLRRLAGLPPDALICCAHEYSLDNIRFALTVDPDNPSLLAWAEQARALRNAGRPTLPVSLEEEIARNPFLRCDEDGFRTRWPHLADGAGQVDPDRLFATLRSMKNSFR